MLDELKDLTTSAPGELPKPRLPRRQAAEDVTFDAFAGDDASAVDEVEEQVVLEEADGVDGFVALSDDADPSAPQEVQEEEHVEQSATVPHSR